MATPTTLEQTRIHENRGFAHGPVAILWDIENCPIPSDVKSEDVAKNIRTGLQLHHTIVGAITMFSAYGDFHAFSKRLREGCQRTGIKLVDVPNGRKDAADKAILVDMFLFALDNPPPSSIVLISGDVDFAQALHILGQRRYTVILVVPSRGNVSSALISSGQIVLDWPDIARTGQTDDESTRTKSLSAHSEDQTDLIPWVQPVDLEGLRGQFARMIKISGGSLPLAKVHLEYQKLYGKPLHVSDFGSLKLVNLIKKMPDTFVVEGKGNNKFVRQQQQQQSPLTPARSRPPTLPGIVIREPSQSRLASHQSTSSGSDDISPSDLSGKGKRKAHDSKHKKHKSSKMARLAIGAPPELPADATYFGIPNTGLPAGRPLLKSPDFLMTNYLHRITSPDNMKPLVEEDTGNLMRPFVCDHISSMLHLSNLYDRLMTSTDAAIRAERDATLQEVERLSDDLQAAAQAQSSLQAKLHLVTTERDDLVKEKESFSSQLQNRNAEVEDLRKRLKKEELRRELAVRKAAKEAIAKFKVSREFEYLKYDIAVEYMEDGFQAGMRSLRRLYPEVDYRQIQMEFPNEGQPAGVEQVVEEASPKED